MDDDVDTLSREPLIAEVRRLRDGIRAHRDSKGHELCWHHPALWGLLPEKIQPEIAAMRQNPEARPHMEAAAALATFDPIVCEVADSVSLRGTPGTRKQ